MRSTSWRFQVMLKLATVFAMAVCTQLQAKEWETATPESQGMDSAALAQLVEYGGNVKMDSLVVVRNGHIVAEAYYAPYRKEMLHRINSSTKVFVGALTGIAISRGELPGVDTAVLDLFPGATPADAGWKAVKLQHLLDMTSGVDWAEPLSDARPATMFAMERSPNWERFIFERGMAQAPGVGFNYNSGNPHLLTVALSRNTHMTAEAYAAKHLFEPLGIGNYRWRTDAQGVAIGGWGLYLQTRDMARFGVMYLQHGQWEGRQVVPRAWVDRVFAPRVEMGFPGYRYADFWWSIPQRKAYFAAGLNRQVIMVLPELGVVAAVTGRSHYPFEDLIGHLERATKSASALADNEAAGARLRERVAAAGAEQSQATSVAEHVSLTRAAWRLDENPMGVRELSLDFTAPRPAYNIKLRTREFAGLLGVEGRFAEGSDAGSPVFTKSHWTSADTLQVEQRWPEEGGVLLYTLKFEGDDLELSHTNMFGVRGTTHGRRIAP
jgi:CubicO group peptidase (beta-lactamase class C family)